MDEVIPRQIIEAWRVDYNTARPHSSLGYRTPEEYAGDMGGEKGCGKVQPTFPLRLEIPQKARDSHFPTASATTGSSHTPPSKFRTNPRVLTYDWIKNGGQVKRDISIRRQAPLRPIKLGSP
jgi:hypothetical protein